MNATGFKDSVKDPQETHKYALKGKYGPNLLRSTTLTCWTNKEKDPSMVMKTELHVLVIVLFLLSAYCYEMPILIKAMPQYTPQPCAQTECAYAGITSWLCETKCLSLTNERSGPRATVTPVEWLQIQTFTIWDIACPLINGTCMVVYYSDTVVAEGCITKEVVVSIAEFVLARSLYIQYKMKCKLCKRYRKWCP